MPWIKIVGAGYWTLFVATFLTIAVWETFQPKRPLSYPAQTRWGRHALLFAVSGLAQSAVFRISPVLIAAAAANNRFGILNHAWLPYGVRWAAAVILLDLLHYATHRVFHAVPYLWRIHEIHHSDPDYDVSTAVRFHPIEVVSEQGIYVVSRPPMQVRPALPRRGPPSSTRRLPGPRGAEGALSRTGPPRDRKYCNRSRVRREECWPNRGLGHLIGEVRKHGFVFQVRKGRKQRRESDGAPDAPCPQPHQQACEHAAFLNQAAVVKQDRSHHRFRTEEED
jgi:hypothetical protein